MARELGQFAHRHLVGGIGQPVGIAEGRLGQAELAGALGHEVGGKDPLVAGHAFGERDAGIVAALDDGAVQEIVDRNLAVDGGEHRRAARRRAALAPGVLADPVFVGQLDVALLEGVEDHLGRHQLHHAGRRAQFVGVLLEQHAAAGRPRSGSRSARRRQSRPRPSWRPARCCWRRRRPRPSRPRAPATAAIRPRHGHHGRGVRFAGNGGLGCHRRCPESGRSNSWKYRKQHRFLDLSPRRSDCGAGRTTVS